MSAGPLTAPLQALPRGSVGRQRGAVTAPSTDAVASGERVTGPRMAQGGSRKGETRFSFSSSRLVQFPFCAQGLLATF